MSILLDSSVLKDYLRGHDYAKDMIASHDQAPISALTIHELLEAKDAQRDEQALRLFLFSFEALPVTGVIAEEAVALRKQFSINIPCALVWATARQHQLQLLVAPDSYFSGIKDSTLRAA
jgi:predicted nucleic acid-binding protein